MITDTVSQPQVEIRHEDPSTNRIIAGFSGFGLAGLTAVDYIVDQLELEETGHITVDALPSITPFENGRPRHHSRLFSKPESDVTVLVNELFVPLGAANAYADALLKWTKETEVEEIAVVSGIPVAHGPDDHQTFFIATADYYTERLDGHDIPPMGTGFLDGINAALMECGMDSSLRVGVYVTPVHMQVPDAQAAIRLIDSLESVYNLNIDTTDLMDFASDIEQYYAQLSERVQSARQEQRPDERMYV